MMPSLWGYIRSSTRDAVLAGFQDAIEIVERGDGPADHHAASQAFLSKLGEKKIPLRIEASPQPQTNAASTNSANGKPTPASEKPSPGSFDAELDARLEKAGAQVRSGLDAQAMNAMPDRPRRGRPPGKGKDGQKD